MPPKKGRGKGASNKRSYGNEAGDVCSPDQPWVKNRAPTDEKRITFYIRRNDGVPLRLFTDLLRLGGGMGIRGRLTPCAGNEDNTFFTVVCEGEAADLQRYWNYVEIVSVVIGDISDLIAVPADEILVAHSEADHNFVVQRVVLLDDAGVPVAEVGDKCTQVEAAKVVVADKITQTCLTYKKDGDSLALNGLERDEEIAKSLCTDPYFLAESQPLEEEDSDAESQSILSRKWRDRSAR